MRTKNFMFLITTYNGQDKYYYFFKCLGHFAPHSFNIRLYSLNMQSHVRHKSIVFFRDYYLTMFSIQGQNNITCKFLLSSSGPGFRSYAAFHYSTRCELTAKKAVTFGAANMLFWAQEQNKFSRK